MIHFHEVSKRYPGGHEALHDVSFHVPRGEMVFLTGHSGAGKSTLLRLITVSERSTRGQIVVGGLNLARLPRHRVAAFRRHIGVVFQDHRLLMSRCVRDNVALPLVIGGFGHSEITRRVRAALEVVGLRGKEDAYPITLSGGEQQRVGIARAVVHRPAVVLADEPTGNLDPDLSDEIMHLFERFHQVGVTVIIASHDTTLIERMACPVLRLAQGTLAEIPARCLAEAEAAP